MRITEVSAATRSRVRTLLAAAAACSLSACANYSQVISEDADGSYKLIATGISYTMSMPALTAASHQKAASWCAAQDGEPAMDGELVPRAARIAAWCAR